MEHVTNRAKFFILKKSVTWPWKEFPPKMLSRGFPNFCGVRSEGSISPLLKTDRIKPRSGRAPKPLSHARLRPPRKFVNCARPSNRLACPFARLSKKAARELCPGCLRNGGLVSSVRTIRLSGSGPGSGGERQGIACPDTLEL